MARARIGECEKAKRIAGKVYKGKAKTVGLCVGAIGLISLHCFDDC